MQSGFGGGAKRWREERSPLMGAIESDGDLLDVGCANGYLLECLVTWGQERGIALTPHGLDCGSRLVELACTRLPEFAANLHVGNVWDWPPPQRYRYVYLLYDCLPLDSLSEGLYRLLGQFTEPGGRLIVGAYGSRTRREPPFDIATFLSNAGLKVAGTSANAEPPIGARFARVDA